MASNFITTEVSDHKIIKLKVATKVDRGKGIWIFNNQLLRDHNFTEDMKHFITTQTNQQQTNRFDKRTSWDILLQKIMDYCQAFSKNKAKNLNAETYKCINELENLESLHKNEISSETEKQIGELKTKIEEYQKIKSQGILLRSKLPNFENNEPSLAFLQNLEKRKDEENLIYSIYDQDKKQLMTETEEIKNTVYNFWSNIYKKEDENENIQEKFLKNFDKKTNRRG